MTGQSCCVKCWALRLDSGLPSLQDISMDTLWNSSYNLIMILCPPSLSESLTTLDSAPGQCTNFSSLIQCALISPTLCNLL